jgi:trimeric autotransporter adhesin
VAGDGTQGYKGDGGQATSASLYNPYDVAVDTSGNIYIADRLNNRIRMVTRSTGIITTVAGDGTQGYKGDGGQATSAGLTNPYGVAVDASGNIYIADTISQRIRMVTRSTGIITTVAGDGTYGYRGDGGQATSTSLTDPRGVAVDASGNIYIADTNGYRIRMVTRSTGIITLMAGDGTSLYKGDGGQATSTSLYVFGVAVDTSGNIYIADSLNNRIRMVTRSTGIVTTVAGNGIFGYKGDGGQATSAGLTNPYGVAVDASGNIYIADSVSNHIRMVTRSTGIITTVAGDGTYGFTGDGGQATSTSLSDPRGVAVDASGNIYIADTFSNRVRFFSPKASAATLAPLSSPLSSLPSAAPTTSLSSRPSSLRSAAPTTSLSSRPSSLPSAAPATSLSSRPSSLPSAAPATSLSSRPSSLPSAAPTTSLSSRPSSLPSAAPATSLSSRPSSLPSASPTTSLSSRPSPLPSAAPATSLSSPPSSLSPGNTPSSYRYIAVTGN